MYDILIKLLIKRLHNIKNCPPPRFEPATQQLAKCAPLTVTLTLCLFFSEFNTLYTKEAPRSEKKTGGQLFFFQPISLD